MKFSFRKLPPTYQLLLTGVLPLLVLLYMSWRLYSEKENRVSLVSAYSSRIHEANELASLTAELETEAECSLAFALNKGRYSTLVIQRSRTDKWIHTLEESSDTSLTGFLKYTFHDGLVSARAAQDDGTAGIDGESIMDFYHHAIKQFSTIQVITPSGSTILQPLHAAIESQGLLFEMATSLAVTRNRIYASLQTTRDTTAIVSTAATAWHDFKTYEAAFFKKAPASLIQFYNGKENTDAVRPALKYLDYAVIHHEFDSTYSPSQWWSAASGGLNALYKQYQFSRRQVQAGLNNIYQSEVNAKNLTLILLVAVILLVTVFFIFTALAVNKVIKKQAAKVENVSNEEEGMSVHNSPKDNVSDLILEAIYRAGKTNGAMGNGAANGVNGQAASVIKSVTDNYPADGKGKVTNNSQDKGGKRNELTAVSIELNTPQKGPESAVNDDMANYAVTIPAIGALTNGKEGSEEGKKKITPPKPSNEPAA